MGEAIYGAELISVYHRGLQKLHQNITECNREAYKTITEKQKESKEFHLRHKNFLEMKKQYVQNIQKNVYSRKTLNCKFMHKIDVKSRKIV